MGYAELPPTSIALQYVREMLFYNYKVICLQVKRLHYQIRVYLGLKFGEQKYFVQNRDFLNLFSYLERLNIAFIIALGNNVEPGIKSSCCIREKQVTFSEPHKRLYL